MKSYDGANNFLRFRVHEGGIKVVRVRIEDALDSMKCYEIVKRCVINGHY